jgi:hypothetical protein
MRSAMYWEWRGSMSESSRRCMTSVGTRIEERTSRTSYSPISFWSSAICRGLAARRSSLAYQARNSGSSASLGASPWRRAPVPHVSTRNSISLSRSSGGFAQGMSSDRTTRAQAE